MASTLMNGGPLSFWQTYALGAVAVWAAMTPLWATSVCLADASIVDVFWGTGFAALSWLYLAVGPSPVPVRGWLLATLVTVWGVRLSSYIAWRNAGKPEDSRYRQWRTRHGHSWWWRSYLQVFLLQGLLMWVISAPLAAAQYRRAGGPLGPLDGIAIALWASGFLFETIGDLQLARFKADSANRGEVLDRGLWRYTRHPNYFGDAAQWWAYYLIAAAAGGWWTLFSPLLMTFLLLRVSGVALLERNLTETKPEYRAYIESTSAFLPWFPKEPPG